MVLSDGSIQMIFFASDNALSLWTHKKPELFSSVKWWSGPRMGWRAK
jgi:hypothetical protein